MPIYAPLKPAELFYLLMHQRYGVEYQPIVNLQGEIFGYEALARFFDRNGNTVSPLQVFDALHGSPLSFYEVEYAMKQLQLEQAPSEGALFVNLDPHAAAAWGDLDATNPLLRLLCERSNLCIEMIENTGITDAKICQQLATFFCDKRISLALDDLGSPDSLLSLTVLVAVDYVKFDRSWLRHLAEPRYVELFQALLDYVKKSGKKAIVEGVETEQDLKTARSYDIDFIQGFLYKKHFIRHYPNSVAQNGYIPLIQAVDIAV